MRNEVSLPEALLFEVQVTVLLIGLFASALAVHTSMRARRRDIVWVFRALGLICAVTCWFAITSLLHTYNVMTPYQAIILRLLIFIPSVLVCWNFLRNRRE